MSERSIVQRGRASVAPKTSRFRHLFEAMGLTLLVATVLLALAMVSYNSADPSANMAVDTAPRNMLGKDGAWIVDWLFRIFGMAAALVPFVLLDLVGAPAARSRPRLVLAAPLAGAAGRGAGGAGAGGDPDAGILAAEERRSGRPRRSARLGQGRGRRRRRRPGCWRWPPRRWRSRCCSMWWASRSTTGPMSSRSGGGVRKPAASAAAAPAGCAGWPPRRLGARPVGGARRPCRSRLDEDERPALPRRREPSLGDREVDADAAPELDDGRGRGGRAAAAAPPDGAGGGAEAGRAAQGAVAPDDARSRPGRPSSAAAARSARRGAADQVHGDQRGRRCSRTRGCSKPCSTISASTARS